MKYYVQIILWRNLQLFGILSQQQHFKETIKQVNSKLKHAPIWLFAN